MTPPSCTYPHSPRVSDGYLGPGMQWARWDFEPNRPSEFGQWALAHKLHSRGSDFTSAFRDHRNPGQSALRKLWAGTPSQAHKAASAWVLIFDDQPVGVCAWEKTFHNGQWQEGSLVSDKRFACIGRVSLWMSPHLRGKGWMGGLIREVVAPSMRDEAQLFPKSATPFIRATDAAEQIMKRNAKILVIPRFSPDPSGDAVDLANALHLQSPRLGSILRRR